MIWSLSLFPPAPSPHPFFPFSYFNVPSFTVPAFLPTAQFCLWKHLLRWKGRGVRMIYRWHTSLRTEKMMEQMLLYNKLCPGVGKSTHWRTPQVLLVTQTHFFFAQKLSQKPSPLPAMVHICLCSDMKSRGATTQNRDAVRQWVENKGKQRQQGPPICSSCCFHLYSLHRTRRDRLYPLCIPSTFSLCEVMCAPLPLCQISLWAWW